MLADAANAGSSQCGRPAPSQRSVSIGQTGGAILGPSRRRCLLRRDQVPFGPQIEITEVDYNVNDPEFADLVTDRLLAMIRHAGNSADV